MSMNKQVICRNLLVSYMQSGKDQAAHTLLFLHGWRSSRDVWVPLTSLLADQLTSCYALDFPGFGQSQVPIQTMTVGDYAEVVAEFIKKLDLKNVIIVGHSFGGRVGIKLAANYPELVSKLVLVDSAGFPTNKNKTSILGFGAKIVKPFFKPKFMQGLRRKIYKSIGSEDYLATPELQKTYVNVIREDLSEDMKKISCPTLIVNGENDKDTPVEFGKKMNSLIQNSKFIIIPNAGHFSFLDQPEEFEKVLKEFIK